MYISQVRHTLTHKRYSQKVLSEEIPYLGFLTESQLEALPSPKKLYSQLTFNKINYNPESKFMYLIRNRKDCLVSWWNNYNALGTKF